MWLKRNRRHVPFNHAAYALYGFCVLGGWRAGRIGWRWARLRALVFAMIDWKLAEMHRIGSYASPEHPRGPAHPGAVQAVD